MKTTRKALSVLLAVLMLMATMAIAAVPAQAYSTIQFGTYPQTKVSETTALKNAANAATWKSYDYYIGTGSVDGNMNSSNFMKFADFFSGGVKYRAVKFTQYRPYDTSYTSSASHSFQDDNGYSLNTTYYFKYEPLTWRVLDSSTGLILCDSIIDAQAYQNLVWEENGSYYTWKDVTQREKVFANNYASSSVLNWLGTSFYDTAFSASQRENIKSTTINNAAWSSSYSQYDAPSTTNRVFLLSYSEAKNSGYGFSSDSARKAYGTDYAKCQGLFVGSNGFSCWRLRSAGTSSNDACMANFYGVLYNYSDVDDASDGIQPACIISNLTSDISQSQGLYSAGTAELSLVASPAAGGTVSGGGVYDSNRYVDITATPTADYTFDCWKQGSTTVSNRASYRYYFTGNTLLTAYFTQKQRKVVVSADPSAGGTVSGGGTYTEGATATVKATANSGYKFDGWYQGSTLKSSSANYTFTVTGNITLTAKFQKAYTVSVSASPTAGGTVTGGGTYAEGASTTLTATPNPGWEFVGFYDANGARLGNLSPSFTVTQNMTFTAKFVHVDAIPAIKISTDSLNDGDWYLDRDALTASVAAANGMSVEDFKALLGDPFANVYAKYDPQSGIIVLEVPDDDTSLTVILPSDDGYAMYKAGIKQYHAPSGGDNSGNQNQPDNPGNGGDNGSQPQGKVCKYCGEVHTGFLGFFIGLFHSILALFGLRK